MIFFRVVLAALGAAALPARCPAQVTEGARTIRPGHGLLEGYYQYTEQGNVRENALSDVVLRLGLNPRTEIRLGLPSYVRARGGGESASGFGDTSLGVKVRLAGGSSEYGLLRAPRIALIAGTTLPTGERAFRSDRLLPGATLAFVRGLSPRSDLAANLTYARTGGGGEEQGDELSLSVAASYTLRDPLGAYLEYVGASPSGKATGPGVQSLNVGLTYAFGEDSEIDARVGFGLSSGAPDIVFAVGIAQHFP